MSIQEDIQKLDANALVELFVVDATALGGALERFHAGTNQLKASVVWQGNTYSPMPIAAEGFEMTGKGKSPRPTLHCQNVDGLIGALADTYDDLINAKVTRKRTLVKYLDAVNFPGGTNPTADPNQYFADDVYFINRKATQHKTLVDFELASASDVHGKKLPGRQIIQHLCANWQYRGEGCGYAGGPVATVNDVPTTDAGLDDCSKSLTGCKFRFGAHGPLPFGGFPGSSVVSG
jgi:lambda family phage minor tail protein L